MSIKFTINGEPYSVNPTDYPIDLTLNSFIREHVQLTGTKFMCLEGGCGVCICVIKGRHPATKEYQTWATNSCLTLLNSCDGWDIITIEGICSKYSGYHAIQERLAHMNGTQCGYCSPAMVMNMYALVEAKQGKLTMEEIENSFGGNICRCTGYRPILDAMKSFGSDYIDIDFPCENDIEDLYTTICKRTNQICVKGKCEKNRNCKTLKNFAYNETDSRWFIAEWLSDIFDAFKMIGNEKYILVAGGTAHGVYRRSNDIKAFIDINKIEDLHTHRISDVIELGANLSLTETMEILLKASKIQGFEYCGKIVKHLDLVANVPVRNMGTLAGNLFIKHEHEEFPSDIFIILEGIDAKIVIQMDPVKSKIISPVEFLNTDLNKCVMKSIILDKKDPKNFLFKSYKIMPRAQNAHAYVNAAFLIEFDGTKIINSRICFGGIHPKFIHAQNTEKFLENKTLLDPDVFSKAMPILSSEIKPEWTLPDASPEYRKLLACSLFYKFVLSVAPNDKINSKYKSGGSVLKRMLSSGLQTYETNKKVYPVTKAVMKIEALPQCSGEALYANDMPKQPRELHAAFVHATQANAQIAEINPKKALNLPGVVAFYSAKDIPGKNSFVIIIPQLYDEDEEIFANKTIKYFAQPIGMIVAETRKIAEEAALQVEVLYEKLEGKIMPTLKDVLENKAWDRCYTLTLQPGIKHPQVSNKINSGIKIQGNFEIGSQYHFTMEPQTTVCIPHEDGIDVYSATQFIDFAQLAIANSLYIPENSIYLKVRRLGGAYGSKISRSNQIACACALACKLLNRPIRFVQGLESMMSSLGKRFACTSDYEIEVNDQGKIIQLTNKFWEDAGSTRNESPTNHLSLICSKNCYESSNWKIDASTVKTDAPSHTWCRAPGAVEGIAMIENIMEHIARVVNKDPIDVRLANIPSSEKIHKLLPEFIESIEYKIRKQTIDKFNMENRWKKKGLGIAVMNYPIYYLGSFPALVSIYHGDGTVSISHGGIEMGQGINTKVAQVAAYTFGIPMEMIRIHSSDSLMGANSFVSGGGIASESVCMATKKACEILLQRMKPIKDEMPDAKWLEIIHKCYVNNVSLTATDSCKTGDLKPYTVYGIACSEVEVDCLTGNLLVTRVDILEDAGESLSPSIDIGQIEGAFIMGLGYWLTEQLIYDRKTGELLTTRTWNYKVPGVKDIPIDFRIHLLQNNPNEAGFMRSKATGEPPQCLSISVLFAVRDAIDSARKDAGIKDKWYHLGAPTTPELILLACGHTVDNYKLL